MSKSSPMPASASAISERDQFVAMFLAIKRDNPAGARELVAFARLLARNLSRREARARARVANS